jgi:hypothetical protein
LLSQIPVIISFNQEVCNSSNRSREETLHQVKID